MSATRRFMKVETAFAGSWLTTEMYGVCSATALRSSYGSRPVATPWRATCVEVNEGLPPFMESESRLRLGPGL